MKQDRLFEMPKNPNTCRECLYRERWECRSKIIQYCSAIKSNRTENGLKKIKCKNKACELFKLKETTKDVPEKERKDLEYAIDNHCNFDNSIL